MSHSSTQRKKKYKQLGNKIKEAYPGYGTQEWLARRLLVSEVAVHLWTSGACRPHPQRLGYIASLLNLDPFELAALAGYYEDPEQLHKVVSAYDYMCNRNFVDKRALAEKILLAIENKIENESLLQEFRARRKEILLEAINMYVEDARLNR